jgi:hypothetical protein
MDQALVELIEQTARHGFAEHGRGWVIVAAGEHSQIFNVGSAAWPGLLRDVLSSLDAADAHADLRMMLELYEPVSEYLMLVIEEQANGQSEATPVRRKYHVAAPPMA